MLVVMGVELILSGAAVWAQMARVWHAQVAGVAPAITVGWAVTLTGACFFALLEAEVMTGAIAQALRIRKYPGHPIAAELQLRPATASLPGSSKGFKRHAAFLVLRPPHRSIIEVLR